MNDVNDTTSVKVAVRIRPLVQSEISKGCKEVLDVIEENEQILIRSIDRSFTFNHVLPSHTPQNELYDRCVKPVIANLYKGYNVTILAYGQTGSGKTHSMGTTYKGEGDMGVIPRAISDIFDFVRENFCYDFAIKVSFIELYQEVLYDLLSPKPRDQTTLEIREDTVRGIHIPGLTEVPVQAASDVLNALTRGSTGRVTGSTAMNAQSSRSHAIFCVNISMNKKDDSLENKEVKLYLVDLAGSERQKKTGAIGNTFKEGININKGLFVLGNVISCLGDDKAQHGFIPYRDSNLTRLLKDSLGGNSVTLMIACVSPADYNVDETLSTLRYADRARKIKNKPVVNQDPKAAEINNLKRTIQQLRLQIVAQGGPVICPAELELLKREKAILEAKNRDLTVQLSAALVDKTGLHEKVIILQTANETLNKKISELKLQYDVTFHNISVGIENNDAEALKENLTKLLHIQSQFADINTEQKKTAEEIRSHEEDLNKHLMCAPAPGDAEVPAEIQEKQETHTTRQMALNTELIEIQKQLVLKESLATQIAANSRNIVDYQAMANNEARIAALQTERDELMQQLRDAQKGEASGKAAERRRKRVQELEVQLRDLNKKVQEQARLIKLKEKDDQRIAKLNQEIMQMKQTKVRLLRTMKEESDKFRQWKQEKERECQRLKQQDRKKETEIVKMRAMHTKQQNVFKRRVEEAEALNKRLKNILALRKQAQSSKVAGKTEKVGSWIKKEFDLFINLAGAEITLAGLLEDRATLQQQLDTLKSSPEGAESPECKAIEEDIELRSAQIQDIQQKLLDSDEENKSKVRFDKLQSVGEAKFAVKLLFEQAAEIQKEKVQLELKLSELQECNSESQEKVRDAEQHHKVTEAMYLEQLEQLQKSYEEKVAILLQQLRESKEEEEREVREREERIRQLEGRLQSLQDGLNGNSTSPTMNQTYSKIKQEPEDEPHTPFKMPRGSAVVPKIKAVEVVLDDNDKENNSTDDDTDDTDQDPDWRKTPLGKRLIEERKKLVLTRGTLKYPAKRSSEGGCTCKTNCLRSWCGCRKLNTACGNSCKCLPDSCQNKVSNLSGEDGSLRESNGSDSTSTSQSAREDSQPQRKRTRQIFKLDF